jgi:ribulose-5-phosphate 4-epimerase/fuculose-1-phosphate aldolase
MQSNSVTVQAALVGSEWAARVDLAALHRLIDTQYGVGEGIYNHISMRVPGERNFFYIKNHSLMFREVTASNLVKVHLGADLDESSHVNRPGLTLHSAILTARSDVNCAIHIHSIPGLVMSAHKRGLRMLTQNAIRFYGRVGYHPYQGIVEDFSERAQIAEGLGANIALFLRNHGLVVVGAGPGDAFERLRDLIIACETQLMLEASGSEAIEVDREICERVSAQYVRHDAHRATAAWPAWLRLLDSIDAAYRA